jgi:anion-transporting  ArsA/GET3 family ATPase
MRAGKIAAGPSALKRRQPLLEAVQQRQVLICVGSGGVGKTTVAASLALRAAVEGKSALVCTIDPARRLANSLGLSELGNAEARISAEKLASAGLPPEAPLFAMMLDIKQTWDEFIERHAPPNRREQILSSRFYRSLSTNLAGSQEYIAMEKLWQLRAHRDYGLIVLDTPPTAHALDFLDAPNRVLDFLDNDAARWLLAPALTAGKVGLQLFNWGGNYVARTISKLIGIEALQELTQFMLAISGMNESFRQRARQVRALLAAEGTAFVLVVSPNLEGLEEAVRFHTLLQQNHMAIAAVVINRVQTPPRASDWSEAAALQPALREKVEATLRELEAAAAQDAQAIAEVRAHCEPTPVIQVPRFPLDVHDLAGLWRTSRFLFGDERRERAEAG